MTFKNNKALHVSITAILLLISVALEILFCSNYIEIINGFFSIAVILGFQFFSLIRITNLLAEIQTARNRIISSAIISLATSSLFFGLLLNHLLRYCDSNPNHFKDGLLFCALPFGFSLFIFIVYNIVFGIRSGRQRRAE